MMSDMSGVKAGISRKKLGQYHGWWFHSSFRENFRRRFVYVRQRILAFHDDDHQPPEHREVLENDSVFWGFIIFAYLNIEAE